MMLTDEILKNWSTDILGYAQCIDSLSETPFPAWTIKELGAYGVAILYDGAEEINESFSSAKILSKNIAFEKDIVKRALVLTSSSEDIKEVFASLCSDLIDPGKNGSNRENIVASPLAWWQEWKEMLGNKNIDPRIYDVLGELCVLNQFLSAGEDINWNGPDSASYDIEMDSRFIEVKSTIVRDKKEVTISNHFQLKPEGKPLWLVLCQFEPTINSGVSIDSVVSELSKKGYNTLLVNDKLQKMGFEIGMSSRRKTFVLHNMIKYVITDDFPRITPESFIGGVLPPDIVKITYTVDLSGIPCESIVQGANE